jgi:AcrR family transcriptional regulator
MPRSQAQQKDNDTRQRLLEAGLLLFGRHGLEATTTRSLAKEAQANLAAIPYHFGGKEGLYRAVLEHIVASKLMEIGPCLRRAQAACDDAATDRETLLTHLRELVRTLTTTMLRDAQSGSGTQILLQEQIAPTQGFDFLHNGFLLHIHAALSALLGRLTALAPGSLELHLRAMAMLGQIFIFRIGLPSLLHLLQSDRLTDEHLYALVESCIRQAEAFVAGFTAAGTRGMP